MRQRQRLPVSEAISSEMTIESGGLKALLYFLVWVGLGQIKEVPNSSSSLLTSRHLHICHSLGHWCTGTSSYTSWYVVHSVAEWCLCSLALSIYTGSISLCCQQLPTMPTLSDPWCTWKCSVSILFISLIPVLWEVVSRNTWDGKESQASIWSDQISVSSCLLCLPCFPWFGPPSLNPIDFVSYSSLHVKPGP